MLPEPTIQLTIPSLHDDTPLDVRIYHPRALTAPVSSATVDSEADVLVADCARIALVAHPYAPMGGCFDDPVVGIVGRQLLRLGWIVVTFNFRGAMGSAGRTSWTSKPEQDDYASVFAFTACYMRDLRSALSERARTRRGEDPALSNTSVDPRRTESQKPVILLGGYSYGSMVLTSLSPNLAGILSTLGNSESNAAARIIRLRASYLAVAAADAISQASTSNDIASHDPPHSLQAASSIRIGGYEERKSISIPDISSDSSSSDSSPSARTHRPKRTSQASLERLKQKIRLKKHASWLHHLQRLRIAKALETPPSSVPSSGVSDIHDDFTYAYLLISPIQGLIRNLASLWTFNKTGANASANASHEATASKDAPTSPSSLFTTVAKTREHYVSKGVIAANDDKFTRHPTLAVFGDDDTFVGVAKFRAWSHALHALDEMRRDVSADGGTEQVVDRGGSNNSRTPQNIPPAKEDKEDDKSQSQSQSQSKSPRARPANFVHLEVPGAGHFWHDGAAESALKSAVREFAGGL